MNIIIINCIKFTIFGNTIQINYFNKSIQNYINYNYKTLKHSTQSIILINHPLLIYFTILALINYIKHFINLQTI